MHGFNQGRSAIQELIANESVDLFLLQEHWLTPANMYKFDDEFQDFFVLVALPCLNASNLECFPDAHTAGWRC